MSCYNCGHRVGNLVVTCLLPGGGSYGGGNEGDDGVVAEDFPGVDPRALRCPSRGVEPCCRTLPDGNIVKWCSLCGYWGNHFRATHTAENVMGPADEEAQMCGKVDESAEEEEEHLGEHEVSTRTTVQDI